MRKSNAVILSIFGVAWMAFVAIIGCGQQIELVPPGQVVRLAEPVQAKISTYAGRDANGNSIWKVSANRVTLPTGYFVVPPPATTQPATK